MATDMTSKQPSYTPKGLYIGGNWVPGASGKAFTSLNPATGEKLGEVPWAGEDDVDAAVDAAKRGFAEWRRVSAVERASCLERLAERIVAHTD